MKGIMINYYKDETEDNFKRLLDAITATNAGEKRTIVEELQRKLRKDEPEVNKINQFAFVTTELSLQVWLGMLANEDNIIAPKSNVHWKRENNIYYRNINKQSYVRDETEDCQRDRDGQFRPNAEGMEVCRETADELAARWDILARQIRRHNEQARRQIPVWEPLKKSDGNDTKAEDSLIMYTDDKHSIPDWHGTIKKLQTYGTSVGYSTENYKSCLDRLVSFFTPQLRRILSKHDANGLARFMMGFSVPKTDYELLTLEMGTLTRQIGESINQSMSHLKALAETMYAHQNENDRKASVNRLMMDGLINFTMGNTREEVLGTIEYTKSERKPINWVKILAAVVVAENVHGLPTEPLRFNQSIKPIQRIYNVSVPVEVPKVRKPRTVDSRGGASYRPTKHDTVPQIMDTVTDTDEQTNVSMKKRKIREEQKVVPTKVNREGEITDDEEDPDETFVEAKDIEEAAAEAVANRFPSRDRKKTERLGVNMLTQLLLQLDLKKKTFQNNDTTTVSRKRVDSRDNSRDSSRDRKNMDFRTEKTKSDSPRDRFRSPSRDRFRSTSRDKLRSRSTDRNKRERSEPRKDDKRSKQSVGQDRQGRDRSRNNYSGSRDSSSISRDDNRRENRTSDQRRDDRSSYRARNDRSFDRDRRTPSRSRDSSRRREDYSRRRDESIGSRDRISVKAEYGVNCSVDYNPKLGKICMKCLSENNHYEYECKKYYRRSLYLCSSCKMGWHFSRECKTRSRSPSLGRPNFKLKQIENSN